MKVLVTSNSFDKYSDEGTRELEDNGLSVIRNRYGRVMRQEEFIGELCDADAVILSTEDLNETVLKSAPKLKVVSRYGVGIDNIDVPYLERHHIALERAVGCNNQSVADYAVGMIISVCRGMAQSASDMKNRVWKKQTGTDICGKTIGIIGLGAIGREVAKRLSGFGCKLLAYDLYYDDAFCERWNVTKVSFEDVCSSSDIITIHAPANQDGTPLIDAAVISSFKKGVFLINTARRSLVDEKALVGALKDGGVLGYGSDAPLSMQDVTEEMRELDNVTITPHNAAVTLEASKRMSIVSARNVIKHLLS